MDTEQKDKMHVLEIPWLEHFDKMRESASERFPDIDFITRLYEMEGR